jgi:protocatechuate 3,4-dioxygenase beta subunit
VTVLDANSNPVQGASVTLISSRGVTDTITQPASVTDAAGQTTGTVSSVTAGNAVMSAVAGGVNIIQTATVTFTAGSIDAGTSTVVANPTSVVANGSSSSTITVTVLDANSNPVQGASVTLISSRGVTDTITQPAGVTDANGQTTGTVASLTLGNAVISAIAGGTGITQTANVSFVAGPPDATNSTVVASPTNIQADGITTSTITVTLLDANNHPVSGANVILSSSRGLTDTITQPSGVTDVSGQTTGEISSTTSGTAAVSAIGDGVSITQTATVFFEVNSNVIPTIQTGLDDSGDQISDIQIDDAVGAPVTALALGDGQYTVRKNRVMGLSTFDVSSIPIGATITSVVLHLQYGTEVGTYNGTGFVRFDNGIGLTDTSIQPVNTNGVWSADQTFDLLSSGVNTLSEIQNLIIEFTHNGVGGTTVMNFDYLYIEVTYVAP